VAASPDNCAFCAYLGSGCGHITMNAFFRVEPVIGNVTSSFFHAGSRLFFSIPAYCISFRFISTSLSSIFLGFRLLHTVTHTLDSSSPIIARFNSSSDCDTSWFLPSSCLYIKGSRLLSFSLPHEYDWWHPCSET